VFPLVFFLPSSVFILSSLHRYLEKHENVAWISYLGLESHQSNALAKTLLRPGVFGGVLSFGVKGELANATKLVDNLKLASNLANVGKCPFEPSFFPLFAVLY